MTNYNDVIEIKNAFSPTLFAYTKNAIMNENGGCAWAYLENSAYGVMKESQSQPSFSNLVFMDQIRHNSVSSFLEAGLMTMLDNIGISMCNLHRIRIGMMLKSNDNYINDPHIDINFDHMTAILYLTTCNAPTILYDQFYNPSSNINAKNFIDQNKLSVYKKIPCIENTAVIFNGLRYHSSSIQTDIPRRIAVNFNFDIKT